MLKAQDVKWICVTGLYDLNGCPLGFIWLDFCKESPDDVNCILTELKDKAKIISVMLS